MALLILLALIIALFIGLGFVIKWLFIVAVVAALGLGLAWIQNARESTGPYFYIEAGDRIVAKGVKAFSEFALVVDDKDAVLAIRNSDIKKIAIGHEPPPSFAVAPAAGSKP